MSKYKIAYVVNNSAFFVSHRLPLATAAMKAGYDVSLFTGMPGSETMDAHTNEILSASFIPHQIAHFQSAGTNPVFEIFGFLQLFVQLMWYKPTVVHCASPKGILYGGIVARLLGTHCLVLAISGMGYAFSDNRNGILLDLFRYIYSIFMKFVFGHPNIHVIVQNTLDFEMVVDKKWAVESQITLIPGSGVNLDAYPVINPKYKERIVLLPARMIQHKGIFEFVDAARRFKSFDTGWRFVLAGAADYKNPGAISSDLINTWVKEGIVEWEGHVDNMIPLFTAASIVCLPSYYREGMPKALLEASAASCAVVTSDVAGCREAIEDKCTGDIVPSRNSDALFQALLNLMSDDERRIRYSLNARQRAEALFSIDAVVGTTLSIYSRLVRNGKF